MEFKHTRWWVSEFLVVHRSAHSPPEVPDQLWVSLVWGQKCSKCPTITCYKHAHTHTQAQEWEWGWKRWVSSQGKSVQFPGYTTALRNPFLHRNWNPFPPLAHTHTVFPVLVSHRISIDNRLRNLPDWLRLQDRRASGFRTVWVIIV